MFTKVFVFSCLLAGILSAPAEEPVPIISQNSDIGADGSYQWNFETGDGTKQDQVGTVKQVDKEEFASAVQGSAAWKDNEGKDHQITYIADENGYQPQGDDVPKIPEAIARALEWIAAHPEPETKSN